MRKLVTKQISQLCNIIQVILRLKNQFFISSIILTNFFIFNIVYVDPLKIVAAHNMK